jgi:hypothetical protein
VQGNPMQGVFMKDPMASMMQIRDNIRRGLPGFTVTAPASAGPGVAP